METPKPTTLNVQIKRGIEKRFTDHRKLSVIGKI